VTLTPFGDERGDLRPQARPQIDVDVDRHPVADFVLIFEVDQGIGQVPVQGQKRVAGDYERRVFDVRALGETHGAPHVAAHERVGNEVGGDERVARQRRPPNLLGEDGRRGDESERRHQEEAHHRPPSGKRIPAVSCRPWEWKRFGKSPGAPSPARLTSPCT
jgi:hypothetical protein